MSKAFELGVKVGSFIRGIFNNDMVERKDPIWNEAHLESTPLKVVSKSDCYASIVETCQYQTVFLDRLTMFFTKLDQEMLFTTEETETTKKIIQDILSYMKQNDIWITQKIEEIHDINLKIEENIGYPELAQILKNAKKRTNVSGEG
jgi:hypothetical protein